MKKSFHFLYSVPFEDSNFHSNSYYISDSYKYSLVISINWKFYFVDEVYDCCHFFYQFLMEISSNVQLECEMMTL